MDARIIYERKLVCGEHPRVSNTNNVFIPVHYVYDVLVKCRKLSDEMVTTLENSSKWSDHKFLEILYDMVKNEDDSIYLKYDVLILNVKQRKVGGYYTTDSWFQKKREDTISVIIVNNTGEIWAEYWFPPRKCNMNETPILLLNGEGESWTDTCNKMLDGVSIRHLIRNAQKLRKYNKMGSELKRMISRESIEIHNEIEKDIELDEISL